MRYLVASVDFVLFLLSVGLAVVNLNHYVEDDNAEYFLFALVSVAAGAMWLACVLREVSA